VHIYTPPFVVVNNIGSLHALEMASVDSVDTDVAQVLTSAKPVVITGITEPAACA